MFRYYIVGDINHGVLIKDPCSVRLFSKYMKFSASVGQSFNSYNVLHRHFGFSDQEVLEVTLGVNNIGSFLRES